MCDRQVIDVLVERDAHGRPRGAAAELLDVSLTGARICVPVPVQAGEVLRLRLHSETDLDETVSAKVRWVRAGKASNWLAGCVFLEKLSAATIDALAELGFERSPISAEATAWQQLQSSGVTVRLMDLSKGGLSLLSPEAVQLGQRLRLVPHGGENQDGDFIVRVRCCAALGKSYLLSYKFEHGSDFRQLCGSVHVHTDAGREHRSMKKLLRRSPLTWRTGILLLGGIFVGLAVGVTRPQYAVLGLLSVVAYLALEFAEAQPNRLRHSKWSEFFEETARATSRAAPCQPVRRLDCKAGQPVRR